MINGSTIFDYREQWRGPVTISAVLHGAVFCGLLALAAFTSRPGESWGGTGSTGDAMNVTLVTSAIPLPTTPAETENVLANESTGLSESQPVKKALEEPDAVPIPDKTAKIKPEKVPPKPTTKTLPKPVVSASNVVPFGQGGPPAGQYTMVKTDTGTGGLSFGGDGSFGSRYSWYVDAVRRKVSENWQKYEVDPRISDAHRVYITFEIGRSGEPGNLRISQTSGVPSLDLSALRALQRIDTFGPLPNDYRGSKVAVEFWFDYKH